MYFPNKALGYQWSSLNSIETYFEKFQKISPKQSDIIENYMSVRDHYYVLANNNKSLLNELNNINNNQQITLDSIIEETINYIQSQGNLWQYVSKNKKTMVVTLEQGQQLLEQWQNIINLIQDNNWNSANSGLERLDKMCQELQRQLSNNKTVNLSKVLNIKSGKNVTVALSMQGTLNAIRGAVLEEKVVDFLAKNLPDTDNTIVQTGQVRVNIPIFGNENNFRSVDIKEDIIKVMNGFTIKDLNGNDKYIFKDGAIQNINGDTITETITLTEAEYQSLQEAIQSGISAKTTQGTISFHGGYNINKLLIDAGFPGDNIITQIWHFYQLGCANNDLSLYQKYAVSKIALKIIGEKNSFIATKNRIIPTYQYIEQIANKGLYFRNTSLPIRGENAPLNSNFGNTDIYGPKLSI